MAPTTSHPYGYRLAYPATGALNQPSSEGSDVSPASRVTSHGIYTVDTQSGANTLNSLGRQRNYGSRQQGASRKRGACDSFMSDPTDEAGPPAYEAPQQLDNDEDDLNDTDDNTTQQVRDASWYLWLCSVAACACAQS